MSSSEAGSPPRHTNRLARESSLYLLQHAHNPVGLSLMLEGAEAGLSGLKQVAIVATGDREATAALTAMALSGYDPNRARGARSAVVRKQHRGSRIMTAIGEPR